MKFSKVVWFLFCVVVAIFKPTDDSVPSIFELSGSWNEAVPLRGIGPVQNFVGSLGIRGSPYQGNQKTLLQKT